DAKGGGNPGPHHPARDRARTKSDLGRAGRRPERHQAQPAPDVSEFGRIGAPKQDDRGTSLARELGFSRFFSPSARWTNAPLRRADASSALSLPGSRNGRRQVGEFLRVGLIHARAQAVLGQVLREHFADHRHLVGVVYLIAAVPPADPAPGPPLDVTMGNPTALGG